MLAFRIADRRHPIFDATGATLKGGRWNSPGKPVIDAAETYAGAVLEILVHANLGFIPKTLASVQIHIPVALPIETLDPAALPHWNAEDLLASRTFGDLWITEQRSAVLFVPSVVLQGRERNLVLNPAHPDFAAIHADAPKPVLWDPRLFSRTL